MSRITKLYDIRGSITKEPIFNPHWVDKLKDIGFFEAPASTKWHGAYEGGLFDHSYLVGQELQNLTDKLGLEWQREASPWIVGIFHDLCKVDTYKFVPNKDELFEEGDTENGSWIWDDNDVIIKGHGIKSVIYANRILELTPEEEACILYHMGAFTEEKEWRNYTAAIHKYPNVLYTHTADMIASHIHLT